MTRSKDKVIERLSELMPLTNPVTEESIAKMIKEAYEFKKYYKGKYTSNYNRKIMRRFYLYYARLYLDLAAGDGNYSKSKRLTFFNTFSKWAEGVQKIFDKLNFEADFNDDDLHEIMRRTWNERCTA